MSGVFLELSSYLGQTFLYPQIIFSPIPSPAHINCSWISQLTRITYSPCSEDHTPTTSPRGKVPIRLISLTTSGASLYFWAGLLGCFSLFCYSVFHYPLQFLSSHLHPSSTCLVFFLAPPFIPLILSNSKSPLIHSSFAQMYSSNLYIILHYLPTSVDVLHPQQELHQDLHRPRSLPVKASDLPSLSHKVHESCSLFLRKTSVHCPWSHGPQTFICSYPYLQGTHFHSEISCHLKLLQAFLISIATYDLH